MSSNSAIEWTDATWNPVAGCTRVSAGCDHCYAVTMTNRLEAMGQPKYSGLTVLNGKGDRHFNGKISLSESDLTIPLKRKNPTVYFVNSMSDLFHKDVPFEFIAAVYGVMDACEYTWNKPGEEPHGHTFQILTKRPERAFEFYEWVKEQSRGLSPIGPRWSRESTFCFRHANSRIDFRKDANIRLSLSKGVWPLPNVWLGTSVENQETADERIPHLLKCPAAVRFLSVEPLLGPVSLRWLCAWPENAPTTAMRPNREPMNELDGLRRIGWVIVGGESGPGARPMHPDWATSIRDQCVAAGVPFFFKQWGQFSPIATCKGLAWLSVFPDGRTKEASEYEGRASTLTSDAISGAWPLARVAKKAAGRLLDGKEWNQMPISSTKIHRKG